MEVEKLLYKLNKYQKKLENNPNNNIYQQKVKYYEIMIGGGPWWRRKKSVPLTTPVNYSNMTLPKETRANLRIEEIIDRIISGFERDPSRIKFRVGDFYVVYIDNPKKIYIINIEAQLFFIINKEGFIPIPVEQIIMKQNTSQYNNLFKVKDISYIPPNPNIPTESNLTNIKLDLNLSNTPYNQNFTLRHILDLYTRYMVNFKQNLINKPETNIHNKWNTIASSFTSPNII
jgi:hypothetical protein